jgi:hypothetical protein
MSGSEPPLAPTADDLAEAERLDARWERAPQRRAEAVVAGPDGIAVLCTVGSGPGERAQLLTLDHDGSVRGEQESPGIGRALAALPRGGFAVAGEARGEERAYAPHLLRLDGAGAPAAERRVAPSGVSGLAAVAVLPDGTIVAGGSRDGRGWLVAVDSDLEPVWEDELGDEVVGLAALGDGFAAVAVTGRTTTTLGTGILAVYGPDRRERERAPLPAEPAALAATERVLVAVGHIGDAPRVWAAGIDDAGECVWQRELDATGQGCRGRAVAPLPGGGAAVAGDARRGENRGAYLARLDGDGALDWERALDPAEGREEIVGGVAATADGDVVLAGTSTAIPSGAAAAQVRRFDGAGELRWERVFGG